MTSPGQIALKLVRFFFIQSACRNPHAIFLHPRFSFQAKASNKNKQTKTKKIATHITKKCHPSSKILGEEEGAEIRTQSTLGISTPHSVNITLTQPSKFMLNFSAAIIMSSQAYQERSVERQTFSDSRHQIHHRRLLVREKVPRFEPTEPVTFRDLYLSQCKHYPNQTIQIHAQLVCCHHQYFTGLSKKEC